MKKLILLFAAAVLFSMPVFAGLNVIAPDLEPQPTNAPPPPNSFNNVFQQALAWVSTIDTNFNGFDSNRFELASGFVNRNNQQTLINLRLDVRIVGNFWAENDVRNVVALGRVESDQFGFSYAIVNHDFKVSPYVHVGRLFDTQQNYLAPGLRLEKAVGQFTFVSVLAELPVYFENVKGTSSGRGVDSATFGGEFGFWLPGF